MRDRGMCCPPKIRREYDALSPQKRAVIRDQYAWVASGSENKGQPQQILGTRTSKAATDARTPPDVRFFGRFSNRPVGVKHFQAIHHGSVDVCHGAANLSKSDC